MIDHGWSSISMVALGLKGKIVGNHRSSCRFFLEPRGICRNGSTYPRITGGVPSAKWMVAMQQWLPDDCGARQNRRRIQFNWYYQMFQADVSGRFMKKWCKYGLHMVLQELLRKPMRVISGWSQLKDLRCMNPYWRYFLWLSSLSMHPNTRIHIYIYI